MYVKWIRKIKNYKEWVVGCVWIELIFTETENWNWKHCSEIIFKCVNSVVGPIFNKKVAKKCNLWDPEQYTYALFTVDKVNYCGLRKKKKEKKEEENVEKKRRRGFHCKPNGHVILKFLKNMVKSLSPSRRGTLPKVSANHPNDWWDTQIKRYSHSLFCFFPFFFPMLMLTLANVKV